MSVFKAAKILYLCCFSKPSADRAIYRAIRREGMRRIVELGVGTGARALRMIEVAAAQSPRTEIHYTGMDLFEARSEADGPGISLKAAHRVLHPTRAKIQLVPGAPLDGLVRVANMLGKVDLLIFSAGLDISYPKTWRFVPRLLHEHSRICIEERSRDGQPTLRWKSRPEIDLLAFAASGRRAA